MPSEFEEVMKIINMEISPEFASAFKDRLGYIRVQYPHMACTVESCVYGLSSGPPTLVKLLAAGYVLNGGIPLRRFDADDESVQEFEKLSREIEETVAMGQPDVEAQTELDELLSSIAIQGDEWAGEAECL